VLKEKNVNGGIYRDMGFIVCTIHLF